MICVFIKELRQFRHSKAASVLFLVTILLSAASFAISKSPRHQDFIPPLLAAVANLFAGLYQITIIYTSGRRWKNENGDGSIDIVRTTPISPLSVTLAKISAAVLCIFPAYAISMAATLNISPKTPFLQLLATGFLQITAICSLTLGCATFQNKKSSYFDFTMIITVIAMIPFVGCFYAALGDGFALQSFIAADAALAAIATAGISLCICGSSPKSSDRAMVFKLSVTVAAIALPIIFKYTIIKNHHLTEIFSTSFFWAAIIILTGALFERTKQSRRVLSSTISKTFFMFSTGVANSLILFLAFAACSIAALPCSASTNSGILAKVLFFTGICQLTRNKQENNFPATSCIIIVMTIPAAAILQMCLPLDMAWIPELFVIYKPSSNFASAVFAIAGAACYAPVCNTFYKQYFKKEIL